MGRQVLAPPATPGRCRCPRSPLHRKRLGGGEELCTRPAVLHGGTTAESVGTGAGRCHGGGSAIETRRREQQPPTGACAQAECPGGVMLGGCIHPPPRRVPPGGVRTGHGAAQAVGAGPGSSHRGGRAESPTDCGDEVNARPDASQISHFFTANQGETQIRTHVRCRALVRPNSLRASARERPVSAPLARSPGVTSSRTRSLPPSPAPDCSEVGGPAACSSASAPAPARAWSASLAAPGGQRPRGFVRFRRRCHSAPGPDASTEWRV